MKKVLLVASIVLATLTTHAKRVKFSVDLTGVELVGAGAHIIGDFQVVAGLATDSFNTLTPLIKEDTTDIYSLEVELPAFHKYEYRFVNGDYSYDAEFVPIASRVTLFNDNRWIYVDSLDDSVLDIGAIMYAGNAPKDKKLVRFVVDAKNIAVDPSGLHAGMATSSLDPKANALYSFEGSIYEVITYVSDGTYQYRFFNGTTLANAESVAGSCVDGLGNRSISVSADTVFPALCFAACTSCDASTGVEDQSLSSLISVYPNPSNGEVTLDMNAIQNFGVNISDVSGRMVCEYNNKTTMKINLERGVYTISIKTQNGTYTTKKLVIN